MCLPCLKGIFSGASEEGFFFRGQITQVLLFSRMLAAKDHRSELNKNTFSKNILAMNVLGMCLPYEKN